MSADKKQQQQQQLRRDLDAVFKKRDKQQPGDGSGKGRKRARFELERTSIVKAAAPVDAGWKTATAATTPATPLHAGTSAALLGSASQADAVAYAQLPLRTLSLPRAFVAEAGEVVRDAASRVEDMMRAMLHAKGERAASLILRTKYKDKAIQLASSFNQALANSADARVKRELRRAARSDGLSSRQLRRRGLGGIARGDAKGGKHGALNFKSLLALHDMWKAYAARALAAGPPKGAGKKALRKFLLSADLQGSYLHVEKSRTSSLVGQTGIVVEETDAAFALMGTDDRVRLVPKDGAVFALGVAGARVTLFGAQIVGRQRAKMPAAQGAKAGGGPVLRTTAL